MKQIDALKDLNKVDIKFEINAVVEKLELKGICWAFDPIANEYHSV